MGERTAREREREETTSAVCMTDRVLEILKIRQPLNKSYSIVTIVTQVTYTC